MKAFVQVGERFQVLLYLCAIVGGAGLGLAVPTAAPTLGGAISPLLAALLYVTFLSIPLVRLGAALRDLRFLGSVLVVNFVVAPAVVFVVSRPLIDDRALLLGVLLVLLTPCVDYVIVFTGLAGGDRERLLAATPLLMVVQIVLLPGYLFLFAGPTTIALIDVAPFVMAFVTLIVLPLVVAAVTQALARKLPFAAGVHRHSGDVMVPLMMVTLAVVVGSQIHAVAAQLPQLLAAVPIFVVFLCVMLAVGVVAGRLARMDVPAARAVAFSGVTRNSLVVLPLALALPVEFALAPLAVVTQTLIELVGMVVLVRLVPRVVPDRPIVRDTMPPPIVYR